MTEPPGHKPLVANVVVVGPFEEEEEGIGITSDVLQLNCEDLDIPGYLRGDRVRRESAISDRGCVPLSSLVMKPRDHNDSPMSV